MINRLFISLMIILGLVLNSCGSNDNDKQRIDTKSPVITLKGEQSIIVKEGQAYTYKELNATAKDYQDNDISDQIKISPTTVNINTLGCYPIEYIVTDKEGRTVNVTRNIYVVSTYFDMEDRKGWTLSKKQDNSSTLEYKKDEDRGSIAAVLTGVTPEYAYTFSLGEETNYKNKGSVLQWSMKTKDNFSVDIIVQTKDGLRYLRYVNKDSGEGVSDGFENKWKNLIHGIGSNNVDGKWHTFIRDLKADIKRYEPKNEFKSMKKFTFNGIGSIDDVILYNTDKNLAIKKTPIISAPGVVLSFDDSFIDGWHSMDTYFRQNGVVATWFCHRWGSKINPLSDDAITKLKTLASNGDEVGLHTIDHIGTEDKKYDGAEYGTIEDKAQGYLNDQINPGIERMRENDFDPKSFSYPYLSGQAAHNRKIRKVLPHIREFFGRVMEIDSGGQGVPAAKMTEIKVYMDRLKKDKEIGIFVGHLIEDSITKTFSMTKAELKEIIQYAKKIGLKFYTLKEAHNIYLHQ